MQNTALNLQTEDQVLSELQMSEFTTPVLQNFAKAFIKFQHSSPATTNKKVFKYFEPLPIEQLSDNDILYGADREETYKDLMFLFRLCIMSNQFDKFFENKNLYWQSQTIPNLVLMRKWCISNKTK
jgi:hypothetical protein